MTPWTAAYQAPPSMGFSRQGYWSGLPLPVAGYKAVKTSMVTYSNMAESFLVASKTIKDCILEQFKIHNKIERKVQEVSYIPLPSHMHIH